MCSGVLPTSHDWLLTDEAEERGAIPPDIRQKSQRHMTPLLIMHKHTPHEHTKQLHHHHHKFPLKLM